jgi:hypothetical protein
MITENLNERQNIATTPLDPLDPARFSQLTETVKDAFQREISNFVNYLASSSKLVEIPTIEKYSLGTESGNNPIETMTRVILRHPQILERLPLIAITTASGSNLKLGFNSQFVSATQMPARVKSLNSGPFAFVPGDKIAFRTKPDGKNLAVTTVQFPATLIQNLGATTIDEVVAVTAVQALYVTAQITKYSTPTGVLKFLAWGPLAQKLYPNQIEVLPPPYSTQNAIDQLGLSVGVVDTSANRPPANRYQLAANLTVGIDIGCESENSRRELTDLLLNFFSIEMDKRNFCFYGRTVFDDEFDQDSSGRAENYQIELKDQHALTGEAEIPRGPGSGEGVDLVYINRLTVPCTIIDYLDRYVTTAPRRLDEATINQSRVDSDGLPQGDHTGFGETSG